jgi:hypothetical protein
MMGGLSHVSLAADVFTTTVVVNQQTASRGFDSAEAAFDALGQSRLSNFVPYTGVEIVNGLVDFRGLPLGISFPVFGGAQLQLNIPTLGISRTFFGETREESLDLLEDYFKNGDQLDRIMKELAKVSPVDPIAGNPNSLQSRMVAGTFERSFRSIVSKVTAMDPRRRVAATQDSWWKVAAAGADVPLPERTGAVAARTPSVSVGLTGATYKQAGLRSNTVIVPLSYAFPPDPARPFSLDGELQYTDAEGAKQYSVTLGGSYRIGISDSWFLIPSANYGITGSDDLGSAGQMWSGSITSALRLYEGRGYTLWMGNGVSYTQSVKTSIEGYKFDPDLANVVFVNGLVLSTPMPGFGSNTWLEFSIADTRFTGSDLFNRRYDEIGVAIARSSSSRTNPSYWKISLNYLNGSRSEGGSVNLQYNF